MDNFPPTFTTSTGSFFILLGHVSSGRFSGSPGLKRIFSRFLTSSIRSFAALESSSRSLRTISFGGFGAAEVEFSRRGGVGTNWLAERGSPSVEVRDDCPPTPLAPTNALERFEDEYPSPPPSKRAAAKISAEATTLRSEDVYTYMGVRTR